MKNSIGIKSLVLGTVILIVSSTVGCRTSRPSTSAIDATGPAVVSSHHPDTIRASEVVLNATQICRETLHRIQGAKEQWALENRKFDSAVPTDADLLGPGIGYLHEKPKCPSGGIYTLRAGKDVPLCSIAGHSY